ncbi:MAG: RNA methyltransferase [Candidatus Aminicenantes bacterium]|nr:RNA methyltransferase [Candidatus Aminicenantes bacterium]
MATSRRREKIKRVLSLRQGDLRVVLEDVVNTHNASAVVRTCEAAGVMYVDVIYNQPRTFPVNEAISTRAEKWLAINLYSSTQECLSFLKKKGFTIASTALCAEAVPYTEVDFTQKMAIVFGNEAEGISAQAQSMADFLIKIPMLGMVQSLNLSVSVGIILYEALRQRHLENNWSRHRLSSEEIDFFTQLWLNSKPNKAK